MLTCLAVSQAGYGRRGGIGDGTISRAWPCPSFLRTGLNKNLSFAALDGKSQGPGRCSQQPEEPCWRGEEPHKRERDEMPREIRWMFPGEWNSFS